MLTIGIVLIILGVGLGNALVINLGAVLCILDGVFDSPD